jgi:hypothetical protein
LNEQKKEMQGKGILEMMMEEDGDGDGEDEEKSG